MGSVVRGASLASSGSGHHLGHTEAFVESSCYYQCHTGHEQLTSTAICIIGCRVFIHKAQEHMDHRLH